MRINCKLGLHKKYYLYGSNGIICEYCRKTLKEATMSTMLRDGKFQPILRTRKASKE